MDDGRGEEGDDKKEYQQAILAHQEYVKETSQQEEGECQHRHRQHHQPLRLEHMTFDEERGEGPEEGDEAENVESDGNGSHNSL